MPVQVGNLRPHERPHLVHGPAASARLLQCLQRVSTELGQVRVRDVRLDRQRLAQDPRVHHESGNPQGTEPGPEVVHLRSLGVECPDEQDARLS